MVGNIDIQAKMPHEKYYHLFEPLPDFLQVEARSSTGSTATCQDGKSRRFILGHWPRSTASITDYFCEIMHELRRKDVLWAAPKGQDTVDGYLDCQSRDHRAGRRVASRSCCPASCSEIDVPARRSHRRAAWRTP